jgi:hypothetical protein
VAATHADRDRAIRVEENSMSEHTFDTFTRQAAAAVSRRTSLAALGAAALVTGVASSPTIAAKDNDKDKKKAKKIKKKFKKQCNQQKDQCRSILIGAGAAEALICCESCFSNDVLSCLISLSG